VIEVPECEDTETSTCANNGAKICKSGWLNSEGGVAGSKECTVPTPVESDLISGSLFVTPCDPTTLAKDVKKVEKYITKELKIDMTNVVVEIVRDDDVSTDALSVCRITVTLESSMLIDIDVPAAVAAMPAAVQAYGYTFVDATSCEDGEQNGDEDGEDCGGSCAACGSETGDDEDDDLMEAAGSVVSPPAFIFVSIICTLCAMLF
jgi:hypothetical protein